ncbi:MAG: hypothetical protein WBM92_12395 [Aureibaculum sp.]
MKIIGYLLISLFLLGCSNTNSDITLIRVKNISQFDFEDIIVNTSGGENNYGNVISNEVTEYKTFDFAYPYAFIELKIDNNTYTIQPIDYIGETRLTPGKYTYKIDVSPEGDQYSRLILYLVKD